MNLHYAMRWLFERQDAATDRVLVACRPLTASEFTGPVIAGLKPVRDTLVHMLDTQTCHIAWISGRMSREESFARTFPPENYPTLREVEAFWKTVREETAEYFGSQGFDAGLERSVARALPGGGHAVRYPWQVLLHVANHSTQHRSEVAAMLTALGRSPGDLDLLAGSGDPIVVCGNQPAGATGITMSSCHAVRVGELEGASRHRTSPLTHLPRGGRNFALSWTSPTRVERYAPRV